MNALPIDQPEPYFVIQINDPKVDLSTFEMDGCQFQQEDKLKKVLCTNFTVTQPPKKANDSSHSLKTATASATLHSYEKPIVVSPST